MDDEQPQRGELLRSYVLDSVSYYIEKQPHELRQYVLDNYGYVSERHLYWVLKQLTKASLIKRVRYGFYLRIRPSAGASSHGEHH